eukprot:10804864-Alexandrium_andersonii.AAC.1
MSSGCFRGVRLTVEQPARRPNSTRAGDLLSEPWADSLSDSSMPKFHESSALGFTFEGRRLLEG